VIREIEVIGLSRILSRQGVNLLDAGYDPIPFPLFAHQRFPEIQELADLPIREASLFCLSQQVRRKIGPNGVLKPLLNLHNVPNLVQESLVDVGQLVDSFDRVALFHRFGQGKNAVWSWLAQLLFQIVVAQGWVSNCSKGTDFKHT